MTENSSHSSWCFDLIILTLIGIVLYSLFLGSFPLHVPDEGRYGEVAREMLVNHNYVTPTLNGVIFFDKPPLYYWLTAFAMHLAGVNEWTARAAPAFFGLLGTLGIYITGRLLYDRRTGIIAAGILTSMPAYFFAAHYANCDLIVAVCISLSLWSVLIAITRPMYQTRFMISAYLWCALAILAKGLIGIVFPLAIIGLFILLFNRWSLIKRMHILPGLILILLIALPWFIAASRANPDFLHYFFYIQHYQRFISHSFNDQKPFWFYLPVVIIGALPWSLYLGTCILKLIRNIKQRFHASTICEQRDIQGFLWLWILFTLLFFSLPASKIVGYILPIFPPLALVIAHDIVQTRDKLSRLPALLSLLLLSLMGLAFIIAPHIIHVHVSTLVVNVVGLILLLLSGIGVYCYYHKKSIPAIIINANMICMLVMLAFAYLAAIDSTKPIAIWAKKHHIPPSSIYVYDRYPFDLPFYLQAKVNVVSTNWQDTTLPNKDNWRGEFAYGLQYMQAGSIHFINRDTFISTWHEKAPVYAIIYAKHADTFRAETNTKSLRPIAVAQQWWLICNQPSCL